MGVPAHGKGGKANAAPHFTVIRKAPNAMLRRSEKRLDECPTRKGRNPWAGCPWYRNRSTFLALYGMILSGHYDNQPRTQSP